ncbi:MAG: Bug family tripartite tricarboxylate transporter substrate binding protein [Hyphomicrobiaceae bacterium]
MLRSLCLSAMLAGMAAAAAPAFAQDAKDWPSKPVRIILNYAPGGSSDNTMRPYAERLTKALGQQFVLEYRGGASGAIGLEATAKAAPDGYTFGLTPMLSIAIAPHLRKTAFDPLKDFKPVAMVTVATVLFASHPSVPGKTFQEVAEHIKKNPGKLSFGTAGVGAMLHILIEVLKKDHGIDILHVPYRGAGESLQDFLAGNIQLHGDPNTLPHIKAGKGNLLAILDTGRHPDFPNVPVLKEIYPAIDWTSWFGLFAPQGTPDAIVEKMSAELAKLAKDPDVMAFHRNVALTSASSTPAEMTAQLAKDFARFGKIIRDNGIKTE